jgi:cell division septation protein DedD
MKPSVGKTRLERRAEQRQMMTWGLLVLVIGVLSFALGFVVGRRQSEVVPIAQVSAPQPISPAQPPVKAVAEEAVPAAPPPEESLTFYENLSKAETTPLGSGINLPPEKPVQPGNISGAPKPASESAPLKAELPAAKSADKQPLDQVMARLAQSQAEDIRQLPPVAATGGWVVQLFASKSAADAGILRDNLAIKNYPVFIAEADLGAKGLWYRVLIGPFVTRDSALQAQAFAEQKDNLKGFTRQR